MSGKCAVKIIIFNTPHHRLRTLFRPQREKSATFIPYPHSSSQRHAHACPRLRFGHKQRVALATRVLGNKYAAFFPFSAGNEYELYDSCVKKLYIALGNIVGCVNLRLCHPHFARATTLAAVSTQPTLFPWCIIYYSFFLATQKGNFSGFSHIQTLCVISLVIAVPRQTLPILDRYLDRHIYVVYHDKKN